MLFIVSKASNFVGQLDRSLPANRDLFQSAAEDVYIYIFVLCQRKIRICSCCSLMLVIYQFVMLKFQIVLVKRFMFAILKCSMFSSLNLISNPFFAD